MDATEKSCNNTIEYLIFNIVHDLYQVDIFLNVIPFQNAYI